MIERSMPEEWCRRIDSSTSGGRPGASALFQHFGSFALGRRVEVQVETKFRERLERHSEDDPIFFHAFIVAYYAAEGGHPARQIPVNGVALLLEKPGRRFVLLLRTNPPVIVDAIVSTDKKQTAVEKERIVIQIAMPNTQLQISYRLNAGDRIHFRKPLGESRHLRVNREGHPRQRRKAEIVKEGIELKPGNCSIVASRFETVTNADSPDRPAINGIDRRELWEVDRPQLSGRFKSIELQN